MQPVLDAPVGTDGLGAELGVERQGGEEEATRARGLASALHHGLEHGDRFEPRKTRFAWEAATISLDLALTAALGGPEQTFDLNHMCIYAFRLGLIAPCSPHEP